ncbi:MAG: amidohydrolase [Candidatus Marinimicrobia bacterium]|nr:amidohydrolase [Candidatus Neomarinimicrobiota bacterium]
MKNINIHPAISSIEDQLVRHRRHFHQYPEIAYQEKQTAGYIIEQLQGYDLQIAHPVALTGVVARLENGPGPCIALRADMDALPIQETGDVPYKSLNDGVMHACGHDAHMAILLGVVDALHQTRDQWNGTVKFVFQPAEEGPGGARQMIEEGVLEDPGVDAIFGLHVWNYQEFGTIGVKPGPVLAAADEFIITVKGTGGHGAMPQDTVDAILVAAQLVVNLQTITSRSLNPLEAGVVSIGKIEGGDAFNIIANEVVLNGTARSLRAKDRALIRERLLEICAGIGATYGAEIGLDYHDGYPPTVNHPDMTEIVLAAARKIVGDGTGAPFLSMAGEDMSYYLEKVPGCFFFVGSGKATLAAETVPHHCSHFDIDERCLAVGASVFVETVLSMLSG